MKLTTSRRAPPTSASEADNNVFRPPLTTTRHDLLEADGDSNFRETIYLMVKVFGRLIACRDAFGRAVDLTGSQFAVLLGVAYTQGDKGVTIARLAEHVQLAATHVTTEVGRLTRRRLLEKRNNPDDGRSVLVRLTPLGEQAVTDLAPFMQSINDILFAGVQPADYAQMKTFLLRFAQQTDVALEEIKKRGSAS